MEQFRIRPAGALRGRVRVPGDKSIGHRALIFSALAEGTSEIRGFSGGEDNVATARALESMGVGIDWQERQLRVHGVGLHGLRAPTSDIDCGNAGTGMRLLAGLLCGQRFSSVLIGDESLSARPMRRIIDPLRARGAHIDGVSGSKEGELYPPLSVHALNDGESLAGLEFDSPVASAQVKSALLLSGLYAQGPTVVREPVVSRDHTERMMMALGIPLETVGSMVALDVLDWVGSWTGFEWEIPGDISSAAFVLAAAMVVPESSVVLEHVGVNPTRTGFVDAMRRFGARLDLQPKGDAAGREPIAEIVAEAASARGGDVAGEFAHAHDRRSAHLWRSRSDRVKSLQCSRCARTSRQRERQNCDHHAHAQGLWGRLRRTGRRIASLSGQYAARRACSQWRRSPNCDERSRFGSGSRRGDDRRGRCLRRHKLSWLCGTLGKAGSGYSP